MKPVIGHSVMPREMFYGARMEYTDGYLDEYVYQIGVSPLAKKNQAVQIHLAAMSEKQMVTYGKLNGKLSAEKAEYHLQLLEAQLAEVISQYFQWEDPAGENMKLVYGTLTEWRKDQPLSELPLRLIIMVKDALPLTQEEGTALRKALRSEFMNWISEVIADVPVQKKQETSYDAGFRSLFEAGLIPHEKMETGGIERFMTGVAAVCALLGILLRDWFFFQVLAIVIGGYTSFRAFQRKHYVIAGICLVLAIIGLAFTYISCREIKESIHTTVPM